MKKKDVVLLSLYAVKDRYVTPVQIQKLVFLMEKNLPHVIEGPVFNFVPYNYGPFDKDIYSTLDQLAAESLVEIDHSGKWPVFTIKQNGIESIEPKFLGLDKRIQQYLIGLGNFVVSLSFSQLVSAIYKAYPEMRENSVFQGQ